MKHGHTEDYSANCLTCVTDLAMRDAALFGTGKVYISNDSPLNALAKEVHQNNKDKGFYDDTVRTPLEYHMLIVTELAEASEAVRKGQPEHYLDEKGKPEGEAVEIADALIRILDYAGFKNWDLDFIVKQKLNYNKTRSYRHGGKKL